jgi:hypothetical protein
MEIRGIEFMILLRTIIALSIGVFGAEAFAVGPQYITLDLKLVVNNKVITQPVVIVPLGQKSFSQKVMPDQSTFVIEVTPKKDIDNQVYLDFTLRKSVKGKSFIISHPRIITLNNQEATVEEGDSATSDDKNVVLSVTPHFK